MELLVVIAIMAILAALLLPVLARGKAAAQSTACKSNLRQLGIALNMYVADYDQYPGNGAVYLGGAFIGFSQGGMNWLKPYLGEKQDPRSPYSVTPGALTAFHCPAEGPIPPGPVSTWGPGTPGPP